jgi:hypothetical protein
MALFYHLQDKVSRVPESTKKMGCSVTPVSKPIGIQVSGPNVELPIPSNCQIIESKAVMRGALLHLFGMICVISS